MSSAQVTLVAHADWSVNERKRWLTHAVREPDGCWTAHTPRMVADLRGLLAELQAAAGTSGCALAGFDFPIGLPEAYARKAGVSDYLELLPVLGQGPWADFYQVAANPEQISLYRPFYPLRPGGARRSHLVERLGLGDFEHLRRRCERAHPLRRAACPLFWTLGGQQVGKAAISGWRQVLAPGLLDSRVNLAIWPFSGRLERLLRPGSIVVAETYPAEAYHAIGVRFNLGGRDGKSSKRHQAARRLNAAALLDFAQRSGVSLAPELRDEILDGFGDVSDGEDRFDALVGLLWMLHWLGRADFPEPQERAIIRLEGWIFGQRLNADA